MIGVLALWLTYAAAVDVVGDGTCPAAADVARRLRELAPAAPDAAGAAHHRARLSRRDNAVRVELLGAQDEPIAERELPWDASCDDLASAIAVVIAAWEAELDPGLTARVRLRTSPPPAVETAAIVRAQPAPVPVPPRAPPSFEIRLALIASLTGGQLAPGARIGGWIAPGGWRVGIGAAVSGATARAEPVGQRPGAARWTRVAFGVGPEARFNVGRTTLDAHAQALAAALHVEGVGLPTTASDTTAQFGTCAGLHIGRPWGNATPWIGVDLLVWPGRDRLEIAGLSAQGELPRLELQLAVGLSLGRLP